MINFKLSGCHYGDKTILGSIELNLEPGETLCIVGPSGCGKTTLLQALSQLGCNQDSLSWQGDAPEIGYLFQQPRLLPWRTLKQNLMMVDPDSQKVENLLSMVNLDEYQDYFPTQISLGMARRAALARCLLLAPDLVLMDEPLVSLDMPTARQMRGHIQKLICDDPNKCLIYVTHDLDEAIELADRIVVLGGQPSQIVFDAKADCLSKEELEGELKRLLDA